MDLMIRSSPNLSHTNQINTSLITIVEKRCQPKCFKIVFKMGMESNVGILKIVFFHIEYKVT